MLKRSKIVIFLTAFVSSLIIGQSVASIQQQYSPIGADVYRPSVDFNNLPSLGVLGSSTLHNTTITNLTVTGSCTGCGGGGVTTTIAAGQIAFGSATSSIIGTENLKWNTSTQSFNLKGAIFSTGTVGSVDLTGAGTGFAWIPEKAAVRWGVRDGTQWNPLNIGVNSFCGGSNCKATAEDSAAIGADTQAGGARTFVGGSGSVGNGADQAIIGQNNYADAIALRCTIVGTANICYGASGTLVGWQGINEGEGATVMGSGGYNTGRFSVLIALNEDYNQLYKKTALDGVFSVLGGNSVFGSNTEAPSVMNIFATSTTGNVLMLKGIASSTGDYLNIFNSSSTNLFKIDKDGAVTVSGTLQIGRGNSTGQCTLDGAATATCTHTVPASCIPQCTYNSSVLAHTVSCAVSGTTLTAISGTTLDAGVVNYHCF